MRKIWQSIIDARTTMSLPVRAKRLRQLADQGQSPMSVLFYHRVADTHPNTWTISCEEFHRHILLCRNNTEFISLAELQKRSAERFNSQPTSTITFDDGYAENWQFAIPYLIREKIPCTYFVSLGNVLTSTPFPHDKAAGQPLPINTVDELRAMADGGIEIGLHTRTHFDFSRPATPQQIRSEIIEAAAELSDLIGRPIRYFAFPFGLPKQLSPAVIEAVKEAGMQGYCSAYGAYNFPDNDNFHIRRIHGDPDFALFRNWMTYDQRKVRLETKRQHSMVATEATRPLRTMFVITSMPVGGAETLLVNMMDRFDKKRIAPEVTCLKEPGPLGEQIADRHPVHSRLIGGKYDLGIMNRLTKLMCERKVDAVITVGAGDKMFWGRLAARRAGVPVICSALHSTGWPDGVGRLNRLLTKITDGFIAVADHHGEHLSRHEKFPGDRVHIIRNGVDCDRFCPDAEARLRVREELGLKAKTKLIGIVAALRPEKNHKMFVDVAKQVCDQRDDVHFVIVGDGPQRGLIESVIHREGLQRKVHLLGTRHDTPSIVAALDVFLLCSHNEASPVSILEALACEVPVISTQVGSVGETVVDGQTGYLVAPDDRHDMASRALSVLADENRRQAMGRRGREIVCQTGSVDAMVEGYTLLIETLYRQKRGEFASPSLSQEGIVSPASTTGVLQVH
jgi:glycosyltransferase involved in cell wall biosynthesis